MGSPRVWTAAKVITELRNTIGDPSGALLSRWDADTLDGYYNRAALQIVLDTTKVLETTWTATIVADQREYQMPATPPERRGLEIAY